MTLITSFHFKKARIFFKQISLINDRKTVHYIFALSRTNTYFIKSSLFLYINFKKIQYLRVFSQKMIYFLKNKHFEIFTKRLNLLIEKYLLISYHWPHSWLQFSSCSHMNSNNNLTTVLLDFIQVSSLSTHPPKFLPVIFSKPKYDIPLLKISKAFHHP